MKEFWKKLLLEMFLVNNNDELKLIIYYKNKRVNQLIMNNNPTKKTDSLQQTNVIYEFSCPKEDCKLLQNINYIGMINTTLSRRRLHCYTEPSIAMSSLLRWT